VSEVKLSVGMRVFDQEVEMEMTLPQGPTRLGTLLPVFRRVSDSLVELSARRAEEQGRTVSCAKGCGACCRQIVPLAEVDARAVARLVDELPEPRQSEVRERFARAKERLAEADSAAPSESPGVRPTRNVRPRRLGSASRAPFSRTSAARSTKAGPSRAVSSS
jgi:hypothetical protein